MRAVAQASTLKGMSSRDGIPVIASDGRTLMVAEWGDPKGFPVFKLHGSPGSRYDRHYDESMYTRAGARVITYDRPGYGGSDRRPGRITVDCVEDVAAIADALGIDRFAVGGGSGGGRHALAVAARLPDRVTRVECRACPVPFDIPGFDWFAGMDAENVRLSKLSVAGDPVIVTETEGMAARMLSRIAKDPADLFGDEFELPESDLAELARPERHHVTVQSIREAFRQGVWGLIDDDHGLFSPWGFELGELRVPIRLMYGEADTFCPRSHGDWLAEHLPGVEVAVSTGGHATDPELQADRLRWLLQPS
jgi:pimeloyl-ACP methyl ester carboxylesterase